MVTTVLHHLLTILGKCLETEDTKNLTTHIHKYFAQFQKLIQVDVKILPCTVRVCLMVL